MYTFPALSEPTPYPRSKAQRPARCAHSKCWEKAKAGSRINNTISFWITGLISMMRSIKSYHGRSSRTGYGSDFSGAADKADIYHLVFFENAGNNLNFCKKNTFMITL